IADNMLITTYLSCKAPVFIAPAMDLDMFIHPATQQNIDRLRSFGNHIIEPGIGELASHLVGKGRMEEPDEIIRVLENFFATSRQLAGKKMIITAGPTYEKIDPVRFIGNYSSGKMGFALAEACAEQGAEVTLIAGPVSLEAKHTNIHRINVESAEEMYQAATAAWTDADAAILCAAVADYRPEKQAGEKIKREITGEMTLRLLPNPDIAAAMGATKREGQLLVGFALETNNEAAHAESKLKRKNFDFIVLNSLREPGAGFQVDTNKIVIIDKSGKTTYYPLKSKQAVAQDIVNKLATLVK
ncbi:MAG: bifunctional phosphopantothenoylcysteine decarboxylase/phosphopantothenate--cysteine ligase CoaBC, partial [Tannerellaceae bacterium]